MSKHGIVGGLVLIAQVGLFAGCGQSVHEPLTPQEVSKHDGISNNPADEERTLVWSDITDVAAYHPKAMPDAALISAAIKSPASMLATALTHGGAKISGSVVLQDYPVVSGNQTFYKNVTAMMTDAKGSPFIRRISFTVAGAAGKRQIVDIENTSADPHYADLPLSQTHFEISVGLVSRMVAVEDQENDVMFLYPLGVGGIDPGLVKKGSTQILTPMFQNGTLRRSNSIAALSNPTYYRGMPFMAIANAQGVRTSIGFHISILSDEDWASRGQNYLVRGFESHGCMRMRGKDLREFYTILMKGGSDTLPVNVDYFIYNRSADYSIDGRDRKYGELPIIHPYPLVENSYEVVSNVAPKGQPPTYGRDDSAEHLVIMNIASGAPNLTHLSGFNADSVDDLQFFKSMENHDGIAVDPDPNLAPATPAPQQH